MSVTGNAGIGMPIILLHDAEGGIITVELKNGEVCRGVLDEAEDSMNLVLKVGYATDCWRSLILLAARGARTCSLERTDDPANSGKRNRFVRTCIVALCKPVSLHLQHSLARLVFFTSGRLPQARVCLVVGR